MTVRKFFLLAAFFGLGIVGPVAAQDKESDAARARNQHLADATAEKLKASGAIKGASVNIETRDGVVDLHGSITSDAQHEDILRVVKTVQGVKKIQSWLTVGGSSAEPPAAGPVAMPMPTSPYQRTGGQVEGPIGGLPAPIGAAPMIPTGEPVPLNGAGPAMVPLDPAGPRLPPHAWPTYAPYNNMSRVAYPQTYPYNAFPYIGPYYPFPKVPLGWRKVVLEWEDGHWYYGRLSTPNDFWRVKFW